MPRTRLLHPGMPMDEDVATMSMAARQVFAYLPCHADREGRLRDQPFRLKLAICPMDDIDMNAVLEEISGRGHIIRYEIDGRSYIQVRSFSKYQKPHKNEAQSIIPRPESVPPKPTDSGNTVSAREKVDRTRAVSDPDPVSDPVLSTSRVVDPDNCKKFWDAYPARGRSRSSVKETRTAWKVCGLEMLAIMSGLEEWKRSSEWSREDGQAIPGAHRFLVKRRWENPPPRPGAAHREANPPRSKAEIETEVAAKKQEEERIYGSWDEN